MKKLALHYEEILKGEFKLKSLNFLFVFQVNCPGCFLYGIPLVNKLYQKFGQDVSFLGLSTAFEDFEYNNLSNTRLLLEHKQAVGETKKMFDQRGLNTLPYAIDFPIAMDKKADPSFDFSLMATQISELNPNYFIWPKSEQKAMIENVLEYLKSLESISLTFTLNQLRGTPSLLLFNDQYEVLAHRFGHVEYSEIEEQINYHAKKSN